MSEYPLDFQAMLEASSTLVPRVPKGYVLVPVEPTAVMKEEFMDWFNSTGKFNRAYKAMIQAAQEEE